MCIRNFVVAFLRSALDLNTHTRIDFANSIVPDLDFGRLAVGFGLLTLPKMPELKNRKTDYFTPVDIDLNTIAYK